MASRFLVLMLSSVSLVVADSSHQAYNGTYQCIGQAQTTLTLGRSAGANSVEASVAGISPSQTFTATATAPE